MILADTDETGLKQLESKIMDITYDFNWDHGTEIMPVVQDIKYFNYWKKAYLFYRNVEEESVEQTEIAVEFLRLVREYVRKYEEDPKE